MQDLSLRSKRHARLRNKIGFAFRILLFVLLSCLIYNSITSFHHKLADGNITPIKEHNHTLINDRPTQSVKLDYTVLIDQAFTQTEVKIIRNALNDWEYATNGIVLFHTIIGYSPPNPRHIEQGIVYKTVAIRPMKADNDLVILIDGLLSGNIVGYTDRYNLTHQKYETVYTIIERIDSEQEYERVLIHELGHIAGLFHIQDNQTIMFPSEAESSSCITLLDLKYFCYLYGCDAETLSPCNNSSHPLVCSDETFHLY